MTNPKLELIWNATHQDFKTTINGQRYILRTIAGVTKFVPLEEVANESVSAMVKFLAENP